MSGVIAPSQRRARQPSPTQRRAFTLIELILVIAMIGVLMGLAIGSFAASSQGARQRQALTGLVAQLAAVRSRAIDIGQPQLLVLETKLPAEGQPPTQQDVLWQLRRGPASAASLFDLAAESIEHTTTVDLAGLVPVSISGAVLDPAVICFDRRGQARTLTAHTSTTPKNTAYTESAVPAAWLFVKAAIPNTRWTAPTPEWAITFNPLSSSPVLRSGPDLGDWLRSDEANQTLPLSSSAP